MELTPDVLRDIEFRRKGRGYDTEDVDAFRQKVEVWVGEMQARLREATSKLEEAETRARDAEERARTNVESDETIQRTLLLAQRTADAAVKEAEETAARKVAEAEAEAERLVTEARTHRERAIADAEADVREAIDLKRAELLDELASLERTRDTLAGDVALLEVHLENERNRLAEARDQLTRLLEEPGALSPVPAPTLSGVEAPPVEAPAPEPEPVAEVAAAEEPDPLAEPAPAEAEALADPWVAEAPVAAAAVEAVEAEEPATTAEPDPWAASDSVFGDSAADEEAPAPDWASTSEEDWADTPPPPPPPPPGLEVDESAWADAPPPPPPPPPDFDVPAQEDQQATGSFGGLSGPAIPVPDLDEVSEADNPWLADLADEEGGSEEGDRSRFGRRR